MDIQQHAIVVRYTPTETLGLHELNVRLQRGWRVVEIETLGGTLNDQAGSMGALVIIERSSSPEAAAASLEEEKPKEVVEELPEGNGSGTKLPEE